MKLSLILFAAIACVVAATKREESLKQSRRRSLKLPLKLKKEPGQIIAIVAAAEEHAKKAMDTHNEWKKEALLQQKEIEMEMERAKTTTKGSIYPSGRLSNKQKLQCVFSCIWIREADDGNFSSGKAVDRTKQTENHLILLSQIP